MTQEPAISSLPRPSPLVPIQDGLQGDETKISSTSLPEPSALTGDQDPNSFDVVSEDRHTHTPRCASPAEADVLMERATPLSFHATQTPISDPNVAPALGTNCQIGVMVDE